DKEMCTRYKDRKEFYWPSSRTSTEILWGRYIQGRDPEYFKISKHKEGCKCGRELIGEKKRRIDQDGEDGGQINPLKCTRCTFINAQDCTKKCAVCEFVFRRITCECGLTNDPGVTACSLCALSLVEAGSTKSPVKTQEEKP